MKSHLFSLRHGTWGFYSSYIILCIGLLLSAIPAAAQLCTVTNTADSLELIKLYNATDGDNWVNHQNWNTSAPLGTWYGVMVDLPAGECRVVALNLGNNNLNGYIPELSLPYLKVLNLQNNDLSGALPTCTAMQNLEYLSLQNNELSGTIPAFEGLTQLKNCQLYNNQLSGDVPDFQDLAALKILYLHENNLNDSIPDFSALPNLEQLNLSYNNLEGSVPDFSALPNLEQLDLSHNYLQDTIPDFSALPNLEQLRLMDNFLTGAVPDFSALPQMRIFRIAGNFLSGDIPDFSGMPLLEELDLSFNNLSGTIPDFLNLSKVNLCLFNDNSLSGSVPNFSNMPLLYALHIHNNQLSGIFPSFTATPLLKELQVCPNDFSAPLPSFAACPLLNIYEVDMSCFAPCEKVIESDSLALVDLYNSTNGTAWFNADKWLTAAAIIEWPGITLTSDQCFVKEINLAYNHLSGTLPELNLPKLERFLIDHNEVSGSLPIFENSLYLNEIRLDGNQFSGNIPDYTHLTYLYYLRLNNNQLSGTIPMFSDMPYLTALHLQENQLSGLIPDFDNLPQLYELLVCPGNQLEAPLPPLSGCPNLEIFDHSCINSSRISGTVYFDENKNCIYDAGEMPLSYAMLTFNEGASYTLTDAAGYYELGADTGTVQVRLLPFNAHWTATCNNPFVVDIENYDQNIDNVNFGMQAVDTCAYPVIDISTPLLRNCAPATYQVQYINQGTEAMGNTQIIVSFSSQIEVLSASVPYAQGGSAQESIVPVPAYNVYTFYVPTLQVGESTVFDINTLVQCNSQLTGTTACATAEIICENVCPLQGSSDWDGSDLRITGDCADSTFTLKINNIGEAAMEDTTTIAIYEDDILATGILVVNPLDSGGEWEWNDTISAGKTLRAVLLQRPGHPFEYDNPQIVLENCIAANAAVLPSLGYVLTQSEEDTRPFVETECYELVDSFDPNDKSAAPKGIGEHYDILPNDDLRYHIRFQNTGTAPALKVVIRDTLDIAHLDISTLQRGAASHAYTLQIEDNNILVFTFDNINLPPLSENEAASQGYVNFRIAQQSSNMWGDVINNEAAIYFDYNEPVITNNLYHTLADRVKAPKDVIGFEAINAPDLFQISPNPASDFITLNSSETIESVEIYDTAGRLRLAQKGIDNQVDVRNLASGSYFIKAQIQGRNYIYHFTKR